MTRDPWVEDRCMLLRMRQVWKMHQGACRVRKVRLERLAAMENVRNKRLEQRKKLADRLAIQGFVADRDQDAAAACALDRLGYYEDRCEDLIWFLASTT